MQVISNISYVSHPFRCKLNTCQYSFVKSHYTLTSLVSFFYFITPLVSSQYQGNTIYFELSIFALVLVLHTLLLRKFGALHLSDDYVNWFYIYLTRFIFLEFIYHCLECSLVFHTCMFWCVIFSVYLLMIYVIQISSLGSFLLLITLKFVIPLSVLMIAFCTILY